jgi:hypothetical protein
MVIPGPDNPRALFQLFLSFDADIGVSSILDGVAFGNNDPRQIFHAALGRLPESAALSVPAEGYSPGAHLLNALQGVEFQRGFVRLFCSAFPEKRRHFFIHIPKSAGTDLIANLSPRFPTLDWVLTHEAWTTKPALFSRIAALVHESQFSPDLFIHGHMGLHWVLSQKLLRYGDEIFTVVRDPIDAALSQVNYILTRLLKSGADPNPRPDLAKWLEALGLARLETETPRSRLLELAQRALRIPSLVPDNPLCHSLGLLPGGGRTNARVALENLVIANVELTDTDRYQGWLREKFGILAKSRHNASRPILTRDILTREDRDYLDGIVAEDREVYERVRTALAHGNTASIIATRLNIAAH